MTAKAIWEERYRQGGTSDGIAGTQPGDGGLDEAHGARTDTGHVMKRVMRYGLPAIAALLLDVRAFAGPLGYDESSVHRLMMPWTSNGDFGWLLVDYGLFALFLITLGWLLYAKPTYWYRIENVIRYPFARINRMARAHGGFNRKLGILIYSINTLLIFLTLAIWIFLCLWVKHAGFGAIFMAGLALVSVFLVRIIGGKNEHT